MTDHANTAPPSARTASTDLPAIPDLHDFALGVTPAPGVPAENAEAATATPALPPLKPNEARLSTGEIAAVRRLSGLDATNLEGLMSDAGIRILPGGVGQGTYLRCASAYALSSKGAADVPQEKRPPLMPPQSGDELKGRLGQFFEDDWGEILAAYLGQSGRADFRR